MGTEIPYMAHLLIVTGLVLEDGGDERFTYRLVPLPSDRYWRTR